MTRPLGDLFAYFISTPYVDAYQHDWDDPDPGYGRPKVDFAQFAKQMSDQAAAWGEQGIGRASLSGYDLPMHDGRHVLAFGTHGDKKYVAVPRAGSVYEVDVIEVDALSDEWDVT